jgi:peptidyl-prolyl cis-trans isomerase B (cyclophilin B)
VPKASKRERQRINREMRREAMKKAEQRRRRLHTARNVSFLLIPLVILFVVLELTHSSSSSDAITCSSTVPANKPTTQQFSSPPPLTIDPSAKYTAVMDTSCGKITMTLDPADAPQTVNSFVFLAQQGFYNGTFFHRIVTNFVNQGGDPTGKGTGGAGYTLPDEPPANGYKTGSVAMANSGSGTTSSQFFLTVKGGAAQLNSGGAPYKYSILGQMDAKGLAVAQKINTYGSSSGKPSKKIYVLGVTVSSNASSSTTTTTTAAPATTTP